MITKTEFPIHDARRTVLAVSVVVFFCVMLFSASRWPPESPLHVAIEWGGIALLTVAVLGRTWCALYIGGKKAKRLIKVGPYSVTRNPLYVLSIIGAFGAGAQFASISAALIVGLTAYVVFRMLVAHEERTLLVALGDEYIDYIRRVPRFVPKLSLWRDLEQMRVLPQYVLMTFLDGLAFFTAIPISRLLEHLHKIGALPTVFVLP